MSQKIQEEILRGKKATFGEFIWNGKTEQFLGRTGWSWLKITIFYLIFYAFLAGFFCCMMAGFYTTLDLHTPKYTPGDQQSLLRNPSLAFRPQPRPWDVESTLIWYNSGNEEDIRHWVNSLNEFIEFTYERYGYEGETSDIKDCSEDNPAYHGQVCKFDSRLLGDKCTQAEDWGYIRNSPCVILKMNKMIGWVPDVYTTIEELPDHMPEDLRRHIRMKTEDNGGSVPQMVWVSCSGRNPADAEFIGKIEYTPWQGFPAYYFPYLNQPGYMPPIVAVRIVEPKSNVLINIECIAWAWNIMHDKKNRLGLVHFELLQD
ncbi:unnamed protein product, partial [Meganyctiphanes norvegica]